MAHCLTGTARLHGPWRVPASCSTSTDRRILDDQIQKTIRQFSAGFIQQGKKIIVSTVQKFPLILDEISIEVELVIAGEYLYPPPPSGLLR
jgi:type I restriction enzyme, R subunit